MDSFKPVVEAPVPEEAAGAIVDTAVLGARKLENDALAADEAAIVPVAVKDGVAPDVTPKGVNPRAEAEAAVEAGVEALVVLVTVENSEACELEAAPVPKEKLDPLDEDIGTEADTTVGAELAPPLENADPANENAGVEEAGNEVEDATLALEALGKEKESPDEAEEASNDIDEAKLALEPLATENAEAEEAGNGVDGAELALLWGYHGGTISALHYAEEKQIAEKSVNMWLEQLQDLVYDLDNLLDELATEALRRKPMAQPTQASNRSMLRKLIPPCCSTNFTSRAVKFDFNITSKIDKITERLENLLTKKNELNWMNNHVVENDLESESESRSSQVGTSTHYSQVGTSAPQTSTSFPRKDDALGDIKDEAEDKFDEDIWFASDEKRNKMSKESIVELLKEYPLPPPFSARVPAIQEPANYGTDLETSVYEGQIKSGYRIPIHPFAVAFFNHYKMAPGQLVPNGWRKLVGLIYLVQTSGYPVTVHDFMRLYLEVCFIKNVAKCDGWYYIHNRIRVIKGGPKSNKGWHSRYFFIQRPSGKWEFPRKWNAFCKDYEKKGFLAPNAMTKKLLDHIKRRGVLNIDEPLTEQEMRHAGLIPPAPSMPVPPTPVLEPRIVTKSKTQELGIEREKERRCGEGSSPLVKRLRAPTPPVPPLVVEDIPIDKDPIFRPRWTIKRGDSGMPHANVSAQHLSHGVLPSDKLILENQPHEAFAMAHGQAAYNAYCYSSQMQERFSMAMDVARNAETDKRAAEAKAEKLDKEVKALKMENADLLNKAGRFERRCEKLKQEKAEIGNKAIHAFLDGTAGDEWLRRRTEDGLSIFQEGFQKAKELTTAKFPNIFLDDIVVPSFDSPSGETAAPVEVGDVVSPGEKSVRSGNAPPS
ncbi:hypothetical protein RJ640_014610 [Escallonia rubra]|uniref:Uncharacterized protein n=1 Tax=Escallonia rubra TaxID=112253 RepID=A0AA88RDV2_9ASTE|nr:hypothetical protein RJ640_014610 [Escallonia rubra]